jgi:hypothetical protein
MYVVILVGAFVLACAVGYRVGLGRGAAAMLVPLAVVLAISWASMGRDTLIVVAAYGGGPVIVATAVGLALGRAFRRRSP